MSGRRSSWAAWSVETPPRLWTIQNSEQSNHNHPAPASANRTEAVKQECLASIHTIEEGLRISCRPLPNSTRIVPLAQGTALGNKRMNQVTSHLTTPVHLSMLAQLDRGGSQSPKNRDFKFSFLLIKDVIISLV